MWVIIGVAVPVVLAIYGLAHLQQNRTSHGAQGPADSANSRKVGVILASRHADGSNQENPNLRRQANTLQSAEEKDAAARKYLVKWDADEELEPGSNAAPLIDSALTSQDVEEKKPSDKHKQADVKWDEFEVK